MVSAVGQGPLRLSLRAGFLEKREKGRTPSYFGSCSRTNSGYTSALKWAIRRTPGKAWIESVAVILAADESEALGKGTLFSTKLGFRIRVSGLGFVGKQRPRRALANFLRVW
jgi:hypothetical protein